MKCFSHYEWECQMNDIFKNILCNTKRGKIEEWSNLPKPSHLSYNLPVFSAYIKVLSWTKDILPRNFLSGE